MTFLFKKLVFTCARINKKKLIETRRDFSLNTALKNLTKFTNFNFKSLSSLSAFDMNSRTFIILVSSIYDEMILGKYL